MTPGDVLGGRYELESRLGKGGMGEVWRARSVETGERVAVKVLLDDVAADKTLYKRFLREARAASAVKHPNVVELREVQEGEGGAPFLVMELLRGETLGRRLKREGALPAAETAAILLPVFDAVEAAHAAGIVHRDLKPENIFLARDGGDGGERVRVCVLDFGIAKRVEKLAAPVAAGAAETTAAAETTGAMLGTPYYMAPEQALGERDIDGRADVWALGVILYECLSGRRPTEAPTLGAILKIIVTDGVPPLGDVVTDVDPELAEAVTRMLRTSRAERAPTLDGVRAALARQRSSGVVLDLSIAEDEEVPASTASSTTGPTPRRSRRSWRSTLAAGGAAALALATLAFVGRSFDTSPAP
ncbi:MAG: serine/threonine protein kinase, partial [Labilithrix sp.]|nr:serine/threonine protein kinase [Labilithrix sp.]